MLWSASGLGHLKERVEEDAPWDQTLSGGEKQRLSFARILLHRPDIIVLDEATSALDPDSQDKLMKLLTEELNATTIVSVGHRPELEQFHSRKITLERRQGGAKLVNDVEIVRKPGRRLLRGWLGRSGAAQVHDGDACRFRREGRPCKRGCCSGRKEKHRRLKGGAAKSGPSGLRSPSALVKSRTSNRSRERFSISRVCSRRPLIPELQVILSRGRNVWRIEQASRGAILLDAARYFGALRKSLLRARSSVFIIAWDIDSRARLVGESGRADDGLPENFIDFLSALVEREANLKINILLWDYSVLYSLERDPVPVSWLQLRTPKRLRFCLADDLPAGAAHHQKLVVVDDVVAFCGGLDVTIRRWDTCEHHPEDPQRLDPAGEVYPPFHDVQALVEGDAARACGELARERWLRGACERAPQAKGGGDAWPDSVTPDFRDIAVGIARTLPLSDDNEEIREVERLYLDSVARAERSIYVENQYLTFAKFAQVLKARMREVAELEVVFVMPKALNSWIEAGAMELGRARFLAFFAEAGLRERVRFLHPTVERGGQQADVMVHSKVMIVDDVLLHVGSSNLNNRSMGVNIGMRLCNRGANRAAASGD